MIELITSLLLIFISGVLDGLKDRLGDGAAFKDSIFYGKKIFGLGSDFWSKEESWLRKYVNGDPLMPHRKIIVFGIETPLKIDPISDAWHCSKTAQIFLMLSSPIFFYYNPYLSQVDNGLIRVLVWILWLCLGCTAWVQGFNISYDSIFRKKSQ